LQASLFVAACGDDEETTETTEAPAAESTAVDATTAATEPPVEELSGDIVIDGSSTVTPLVTLLAEDFQDAESGVRVTVGTSNDALSLIINPDNDLTLEQLGTMWSPDSEVIVNNWNQIDPSFPDEGMTLFGAGSDSGTFDYFTEEINGDTGVVRTDCNPSEDDNVTINGVSGDSGAIGFLGLSYVLENLDKVKAVAVDSGEGCVTPSADTVIDGSYSPLGRPLFIFIKAEPLPGAEVKALVAYFVENQDELIVEALFIPLNDEQKAQQQEELAAVGAA